MCSQTIYDLLKRVIDQFMSAGKTFTAYDVTVEARNHTDEEFFHNDVRNDIHKSIVVHPFFSDYATEQHEVYPALVYKMVQQAPVVCPSITKVVAAISPTTSVSTTHTRNKRNRLCLRAKTVRKLLGTTTPYTYGTVYCYDTGIYTQDFIGKKPIATYVADCYGNIQISAKTLAAMGIPTSQTTVTVEEIHNANGEHKLVLR